MSAVLSSQSDFTTFSHNLMSSISRRCFNRYRAGYRQFWACTRLSYNLLELISMGACPQTPSEKGDLWPLFRAQSSIILSVLSRLWKTLLKFMHQFTLTYRGHNIQNWVKSYSLSQRPCRPFCSFEKFQVAWRVGGCQTNSEKNWRRKEEEMNYI